MENAAFQVRYNVMDVNSLMTFAGIKGGLNNHCKDVYFVTCIGVGSCYSEEIARVDGLLARKESGGHGRYLRLRELPRLTDPGDITYYAEAYEKWQNGGGRTPELRYGSGEICEPASAALERICRMLRESRSRVSDSIMKNFVIKIFFWLDYLLQNLPGCWTERQSYKLIYSGTLKDQEYLFLYLLTALGVDVLILSPEKEPELAPALLNLSRRLVLGRCAKVAIPAYDRNTVENPGGGRPERNSPGAEAGKEGTAPAHTRISAAAFIRPDRNNRASKPGPGSRAGGPGGNRGESVESASGAAGRSGTAGMALRSGQDSAGGAGRTADSRGGCEKSFEELARLAASVVMISIHDNSGQVIGSGSGIMLASAGYILTNNHVACGGKYYSVRMEGEEKIYDTDEVIKYNPVLDLALIRIRRTLQPLPIYKGEKELLRGQKVVAIGSPLGLFNSVSDGIISGFRKIDGVDMIQFTAPTSPGSSGGAVLNMFGEVIGISTSGMDHGQNINLAVHYRDINMFVRGFI